MFPILLDLLLTSFIIIIIAGILSYLLGSVSEQRHRFKREVVRLAAQPGGVTPTRLALEQNMSVKQATKILNKLVKEGYLDTTVNKEGFLAYKLVDTTIELRRDDT
jgi:predicted transcriptional regulator